MLQARMETSWLVVFIAHAKLRGYGIFRLFPFQWFFALIPST